MIDMDIIEIDSSESEEDVGSGYTESEGKTSNHGAVDQSFEGPTNSSCYKELQNEAIPIITNKRDADANSPTLWHTKNRTAPSPSRPSILKAASSPGVGSHRGPVVVPQFKEPIEASNDNGSKVGLDENNQDRQEPGAESSHQRRSLSYSPQPAVYKTSTGGSHNPIGANGDDHDVHMESDVGGPVDKFRTHGTNDRLRYLPSSSRNDIHGYGSAGTYSHRVVPVSLKVGKSGSSSQPSGSSDAGNRAAGTGDGRRIEDEERVIYQEALQNLGQSKLEDDLPEGFLTVPLLKHQKHALAWMVKKEKSVHCAGGILADDQGLGKTISMIALILKQMSMQAKFTSDNSSRIESETLNLDDDDDGVNVVDKAKQCEENYFQKKPVASTSMHALHNKPAAGTLVVCPVSILRQWARELDEKVTEKANLSVLIYHGGTRTKDPGELTKYHVVLTTYSIVTNEVPKQSLAEDDDGEEKNLERCGLSSEFSTSKKRKQASNAGNMSKKKRKGVKNSNFEYGGGALSRVRWFRVILDEAQIIKNHRTQVARACSGLRAKRRWCLSGTPIQNTIDDLYSYFRFLRYDPYAAYSSFCSLIKQPISRNASHGYKKLQAVLHAVLLRRTKGSLINGKPIVNLPPKKMEPKSVDFSLEERAFYLKLEADSRKQFKAYAAAGTVKQNYASILLMLLRLRQACDHPYLVKGYHSDTVGKDSFVIAKQLPKEMLNNLLNKLESSLALCSVCNDPPEDAVVAMCGHVFCYQCISERLTSDDNMCHVAGCKDTLGTDSVFSWATLKSCTSEELPGNSNASSAHDEECSIEQSSYTSSKTRAVLEILNSICCQNASFESEEGDDTDFYYCTGCDCIPQDTISDEIAEPHACACRNSYTRKPIKAIVFSQWTGMLDLVEIALNRSLIQYRRLDGTMTLASRDRAVRDFNNDPEVTVMLMSLKAGNLGLNMVAACHVILLDLWWNPTTEDQAVDRAHRIGQTRPVTVSRITIKDTVEDRILQLQEEKRNMVSSAFGEDQNGSQATRLTVDDFRYLFMV